MKTGYELFKQLFYEYRGTLVSGYTAASIVPSEYLYKKFLNGNNYFYKNSNSDLVYSCNEDQLVVPSDSIWIDRKKFERLNRLGKINLISNDEES